MDQELIGSNYQGYPLKQCRAPRRKIRHIRGQRQPKSQTFVNLPLTERIEILRSASAVFMLEVFEKKQQ